MRRFLPVCLVFAGLMSAAPALAIQQVVTVGGITYRCPNGCNVNVNPHTGVVSVTDRLGAVVEVINHNNRER